MLDIVYVVGGPTSDDRADLRHSLRTVAEFARFKFRDVWVVGDVPDWFRGARMPLDPKPDKFRNQRASLEAYVTHPGAAAEFVLFNDDMFALDPVDRIEPFRNEARSDTWRADHAGTGHGPECWTCVVKDTAAWAQQRAGHPVGVYECHVPLIFNTRALRDLMLDYPHDRRFAVGELFDLAGVGGPGRHVGNAKCGRADNLDHKLALDMPWISASPDTWAGRLGDLIRSRFQTPSPWED